MLKFSHLTAFSSSLGTFSDKIFHSATLQKENGHEKGKIWDGLEGNYSKINVLGKINRDNEV